MRYLITGANGQLGRELQRRLQKQDFLATTSSNMDITNQVETLHVITTYNPDIVIHGAAYTNVDNAEADPDLAYRINAIGTRNVAAACLKCDAKMVYVSTDYVFDGTLDRPYNEFDQTNPQSIYGKSKLAGEILARQMVNKLFITRTAWLYGDGNNFVRTMLKLGKERDAIKVVNDQHGCPTSTVDLAEAILQLVQTEYYGTYHTACTGMTTWYAFANKIFQLAGINNVKVLPQKTIELGRPASRPAYSAMDNLMLRLTIGKVMRSWEEALQDYVESAQD